MKRTPTFSLLAFLCVGAALAFFPFMSFAQTPGYILMLAPPAPPSITAPSGGTALLTIMIIPVNGFKGTVSFTCAITGGGPPLPTCSNPPSVNVTGNGTFNSSVSVTTTSATPTATYMITVTGKDAGGNAPLNPATAMPLSVSHQYSVGNDGGGGGALLTLAVLLALWGMARVWRSRRAALQ